MLSERTAKPFLFYFFFFEIVIPLHPNCYLLTKIVPWIPTELICLVMLLYSILGIVQGFLSICHQQSLWSLRDF